MKLRKVIKSILPHGLLMYIIGQRLREFSIENYRKNYIVPEMDKDPKILLGDMPEQVISIEGFGYSGSSALVDFFKEFDNCSVWGFSDVKDGGKLARQHSNQHACEINFMRLAGGIFEIEKLIESKNMFVNDALINRFISLIDYSLVQAGKQNSFYNIYFKKLVCDFLNTLIDFSIDGLDYSYFNPHLNNFSKNKCSIYFMKNLSKNEFISLSHMFLEKLIRAQKVKKFLVLDQFLSDTEYDLKKYSNYISNLKTIMVYRDPRDVYMTAKNLNIPWIPVNQIHLFIKWYKLMVKNIPLMRDEASVLIIRFEDLVLDYDNLIKSIMEFLNIEFSSHVYPKGYFDPAISIKNIGLWKNNITVSEVENIKLIHEELCEWCYE